MNISRTMIKNFIASYQLDRRHPAEPDDVKPIISSTFNSRGQVDPINMKAYPEGKMKLIFDYQDRHEKMNYLHTMPKGEAKSIALELVPLFLIQGAPVILQSDNGRQFVAAIIDEMLKIWKDCK